MKKLLVILVALSLLLACGCTANNGGAAPDAGSATSTAGGTTPAVGGETSVGGATSAEGGDTSAAGGDTSAAGGADVLEFGKKEDAKFFLQMDINPSVIIGYAEDEMVVYLASNNEDGYALLEKHDAATILGEPVNAAIGSIMTAAHEDGYDAAGFDVAISYVGEDRGDAEAVLQMARQAVETCDFDIKMTVEEEAEIVYSAETGIAENPGQSEPQVCDVCDGSGRVVCEGCGGAGEAVVIVQREIEVRNDYVCEICGGKGWIDDGMHGGEKGNCDSCGGVEGKHPSGDFMELAYDHIMVDEEEMRRCERCDGACETDCPKCNGAGVLN